VILENTGKGGESVIDAINRRVSVRTYAHRAVEREKMGRIVSLLRANCEGPFGNRVRFELIDFSEIERSEIKKLGTYGFISGARLYIASAVKGGSGAMEDVGYCLERVIVAATGLGLGTCWLGGTFKRAHFAERMNVSDDEVVPAITPIGYAHKRRRVGEVALRRLAGSDRRKPWGDLFFDGDTDSPLSKEAAGKYTAPLECVRLGPSASNNQPWRIIRHKDQGAFQFCLKRTRGYGRMFKGVDLQRIDMGIAMCHFELAAGETGISGTWAVEKPHPHVRGMQYVATWRER
jgi:hypothetical protein